MKAKITRGASFVGLLNYILRISKGGVGAEDLEDQLLTGTDAKRLAQLMRAVSRLRPDIKKPVWHCSLSLPADERLSNEKWEAVAAEFVKRMAETEGMNPADLIYKAVRHTDGKYDHIHICLNRVSLKGKVFLGQREALKAIRITRELEQLYKLTPTATLSSERETKRESDKSRRLREYKGLISPEEQLKATIAVIIEQAKADIAAGQSVNYFEFCRRLNKCGIRVIPQIQQKGGLPHLAGMVYQCLDNDDKPYSLKASALGSSFTWRKLAQAGLTFDPADELTAQAVLFQLEQAETGGTVQIGRVITPEVVESEVVTIEAVEPVSAPLTAAQSKDIFYGGGDRHIINIGDMARRVAALKTAAQAVPPEVATSEPIEPEPVIPPDDKQPPEQAIASAAKPKLTIKKRKM
jgi:hypothetical protein